MECHEVRDLFSEYLDKEIDAPLSAEISRHLDGCDACRAELAELAKTLQVVHRLPRQESALELWQEFAPRFAQVMAEENMGSARLYFSQVANAVKEGWSIFLSVVRMNTYDALTSNPKSH
ncbi:MAG TPA: zf-HC2 domain-containing protein [Armatimonadota bacterium]|jgi:anti-sigma factor RsiW